MTLIRELIDIPLQVQEGDFVLKLTQGIGDGSARTVDSYVVTDDVKSAFNDALGLVASAMTDGQSKAAFLQGSFGSGKSHFMAMLHLLLARDTHARSKPELHGLLDTWGPRLDGKKFLQVPVHFLEANSMEQKILGGYVDKVLELHPGGNLPPVYLGDEIVAAELPNLRDRFGEEPLLDGLNEASEDEWGNGEWTTEKVSNALKAPATDPARQKLVEAYIKAFRPGTVLEARTTGAGFIDLDRGLAAISVHAQQLGYDGVILYLDELILWLAANIGDLAFVQRESQKLTKLVEATAAGRPVPIVSFIARQRDLRELVGDHIAGAEQRSFADNLELQQGRFGRIKLSSGNLPMVAKQRLLQPVDDAAETAIAGAVDEALAGRDEIKRHLLGTTADDDLFRTVYPFSPALVQALVDVSEALQRERTALKVMLQLLVDQRDTLKVGEIIPVGDLWDVVADRDEPFSSELKSLFEIAKKLWRTKIEPALKALNNVDESTPADARERQALMTDSRLLKTVLLAALVPEVEAFRGLDAARLVALNWGSITSPIPGQETQLVANKLKRLAGQVGELSIGDDPTNPTVAIRLANVDTEDIIARAAESFDNQGTRRTKIRNLIGTALNDRIGADLRGTFEHEWRGSRRDVDVVFGNVRDTNEMADNTLTASPDRPKLIIDFPFDERGRSPEDDLERLDAWSQHHGATPTVCWLPSFFNAHGLATLKRYVAVDELLKQDRFAQYTRHLSAAQRAEAKPIVESLRSQLAAQLHTAVLVAYGVISGHDPLVDATQRLTDHHRSLDPTLVIRPTTRPTLEGALGEICDQIFSSQYPGHPKFDAVVTTPHLRTAWSEIKRALADPDNRVTVESSNRRALRAVANPLTLGTMYESHFVLDSYWRSQLDRHLGRSNDHATVDQMRAWIDAVPDGPRGLDPQVADLIVMTVAAQTDHRLMHRGQTYEIAPGRPMPGDVELVREQLPDESEWAPAVQRAASLFGLTFNGRVTGPELISMGTKVREQADALASASDELTTQLTKTYKDWGLAEGSRLATALASTELVRTLQRAEDLSVVSTLAGFEAPTSDEAAAKSLTTAGTIAAALKGANLELWKTARTAVEHDANDALRSDQLVVDFRQAETRIEADATRFVGRAHAERSVTDPGQHPGTSTANQSGPVSHNADDHGSSAISNARNVNQGSSTPADTVERRITSDTDLESALSEIQTALRSGPIIVSWREDQA
jgi:hypothetical protein